jgi:hypothetical protein
VSSRTRVPTPSVLSRALASVRASPPLHFSFSAPPLFLLRPSALPSPPLHSSFSTPPLFLVASLVLARAGRERGRSSRRTPNTPPALPMIGGRYMRSLAQPLLERRGRRGRSRKVAAVAWLDRRGGGRRRGRTRGERGRGRGGAVTRGAAGGGEPGQGDGQVGLG